MGYLIRVLIGIDQLINCLLGGMPDETISAKSWRMRERSLFWYYLRIMIDGIFWFSKNHCYESWVSEEYRKQISSEYAEKINSR